MAVNTRTYITVDPYQQQIPPQGTGVTPESKYNLKQFKSITIALAGITEGAVQTLDEAPVVSPRIGSLRYAVGAWATALAGEGLYVLKSTGWTKIV